MDPVRPRTNIARQGAAEDGWLGYQWLALRCVPRVDREEFVNVGVVVYSQDAGFLEVATHLDPERLLALHPGIDLDVLRDALATVEAVCRGDAVAGLDAGARPWRRFGWLEAPRSTVVQPGRPHGGVTRDPAAELARLLDTIVR